MTGIIACEETQEVTKAFREQGHIFYSCDLKRASGGHDSWHIQDDILHELSRRFHVYDFMGGHPVCRYLANSGVRWLASTKPLPGFEWSDKYRIYINPERYELMRQGAMFFKSLLSCVQNIGRGYLENPIMHKYAMELIGVQPTQIIQPWMFGHTTCKATCLWLVNVPPLVPTKIIPKELRTHEIHACPPGPERETIRSRTFPGIAKAMAEQWGNIETVKQTA